MPDVESRLVRWSRPIDPTSVPVRVIYQHPLLAGSNTQLLTLNDTDLQELAALYAELQ
jgi:hypothetical protein